VFFINTALKKRDLDSIGRKLTIMYILNVTDIIFTLLLLHTGMFAEANSIMAPLVNHRQLLSIIIKIVVPFVLLIAVYQRMKDGTEKQLYQSNIMINVCLIFYGLINISHVVWSILYSVVKV